MARTVMELVAEAEAAVPAVSPVEARRWRETDPDVLVIDVRDLANRRASGMIDGAVAISAGNLPFAADTEVPAAWRDRRLQDRRRPVITVCDLGPMSALAAGTLKEMGFTDVAYLAGGTHAWKDAGCATEPPTDA